MEHVKVGLLALGGLAIASSAYALSKNHLAAQEQISSPSAKNEVESKKEQFNPYILRRNERIKNQPLVTYIVVGAGNRGSVYATYALENPSIAKVVGVAEPNRYRLETFLKKHGNTIPPENVFTDWKDIVQREKMADVAVITTPDTLHTEPVIALAQKGYHILVEKPMAIKEEDCGLMAKTAQENNVILAVGHVMRYTPYTQKIKELVDSGIIGDVVTIQHVEPVGHRHYSHSYVRGNWRRKDQATFSLMAKSCHDIDWIRYIMGVPCTRISSFGHLNHFRKENKPAAAGNATRCLDCPIQNSCTYSATQIYLDSVKQGNTGWPVSVIVNAPPDIESVTDALRNGPYGRCAYESDNDVCDNQVVNLDFEGGKTATFAMVAFTEAQCVRKTRIYGTQGELDCDGTDIRLVQFSDPKLTPKIISPEKEFTFSEMKGHGGGDWYLMDAYLAAVAFKDTNLILSGPKETLESHLLVFAAEQSRLDGTVVNTKEITNKWVV